MYCVDTINTKCGDIIYFYIDIVNNKPWYRIIQQSKFSNSSFYDGDDLDRATQLYKELLLAFKGIKECENFYVPNVNINDTTQDQSLKVKPLFLGITDF